MRRRTHILRTAGYPSERTGNGYLVKRQVDRLVDDNRQ